MKAHRRSAMILATLFALSPVPATKLHAAPLVALEAQAGAFYSMTALPDLIPAFQSGWDLRLSMVAETTDIFAAPSGTEPAGLAQSPIFSARLRADVFGGRLSALLRRRSMSGTVDTSPVEWGRAACGRSRADRCAAT